MFRFSDPLVKDEGLGSGALGDRYTISTMAYYSGGSIE